MSAQPTALSAAAPWLNWAWGETPAVAGRQLWVLAQGGWKRARRSGAWPPVHAWC